jgi:hypothetical protein
MSQKVTPSADGDEVGPAAKKGRNRAVSSIEKDKVKLSLTRIKRQLK